MYCSFALVVKSWKRSKYLLKAGRPNQGWSSVARNYYIATKKNQLMNKMFMVAPSIITPKPLSRINNCWYIHTIGYYRLTRRHKLRPHTTTLWMSWYHVVQKRMYWMIPCTPGTKEAKAKSMLLQVTMIVALIWGCGGGEEIHGRRHEGDWGIPGHWLCSVSWSGCWLHRCIHWCVYSKKKKN